MTDANCVEMIVFISHEQVINLAQASLRRVNILLLTLRAKRKSCVLSIESHTYMLGDHRHFFPIFRLLHP